MAKKFTDLELASALTTNDVIAIVDDSNSSSRRITAENVSDYVLSQSTLNAETNKGNLITVLNGESNVANNLRSNFLFIPKTNQYQNGDFFLDYNNLQNKPLNSNNNSAFINTEKFVSLRADGTGPTLLKFRNVEDAGSAGTEQTVTTDHILEGNSDNKRFYSDAKVTTAITNAFGGLFNQFSSTFDGGNVSDSLQDVTAVWLAEGTSGAGTSKTIRIQDTQKELQSSFAEGQTLRVYGGDRSTHPTDIGAVQASVDAANGAFEYVTTGTPGALTVRYKIAFFNLTDGQIGPRSIVSDPNNSSNLSIIRHSNFADGDTVQTVKNLFNPTNYIEMTISSSTTNRGVCVWRQVGGTGNPYKLTAILGPKDLQGGQVWRDYYAFDYTAWSGKDETDNTYLAPTSDLVGGRNVIHFPHQIGEVTEQDLIGLRGWVDVVIQADGATPGVIKGENGEITLNVATADDLVSINGTGNAVVQNTCYVAHNDTEKLQTAIDSKADADQRSLNLNGKTYNATHITIPDRFGLTGITGISKIRKLPFSGHTSAVNTGLGTLDNSLIKAKETVNSTQISISGVDFEGNNRNQYLLQDATGNTFMDFGIQSDSILIQNCRIRNVVGEGINASSPTAFKMLACEISNSGTTDRHEFSPLTIDDGENTIITGNLIQNYTNFIDASVTKQGVIANNIIKNLTGNIQDGEENTDVGSAIFTYGSTFLISSPNVMMGPSNEFLTSPDVFNSEFDAVNILRSNMNNAQNAGDDYESDIFVYQENGAVFDLTQDSVQNTGGTIKYRTNLIRKLGDASNSTEEIYGNLVGPGARDIRNNSFLTTNISNYGLIQGETYEIKVVGNTDWSRAGAVANIVGAEFLYNGNALKQIDNSTNPTSGTVSPGFAVQYQDRGTAALTGVTQINSNGVVPQVGTDIQVGDKITVSASTPSAASSLVTGTFDVTARNGNGNEFTIAGAGAATATEFSNAGVQLHKVVVQNSISFANVSSGLDKTQGQFKFAISNNTDGSLGRLLGSGGFSSGEISTIFNSQVRSSEADASKLHPPGSYHVGIAWSANYRYYVKAGDITTGGRWSNHRQLDTNGKDTNTEESFLNIDYNGKNMNKGTDNDPMNANRAYRDFECEVENAQYLTTGMKIKYHNKGDFLVGGNTDYNEHGILVFIGPSATAGNNLIRTRHFSSEANPYIANATNSDAVTVGGTSGTINIIDDFVMTQGLIK